MLRTLSDAILCLMALVILLVVPATTVPNYEAAKSVARLALFDLKMWAYDWLGSYHRRTSVMARAFQSTINVFQAAGVIGELAFEGPLRGQPAILTVGAGGAVAADIVVGRWFTMAANGTDAIPGGTGAIGGVLANPKNYAAGGVAGNSLAPTLVVPAGTVGELVYMGAIWIAAPAAVALGQAAKYNTTTGVIGVGAPGAGEAAIPESKFIRYPNAAPGLAVLELTN